MTILLILSLAVIGVAAVALTIKPNSNLLDFLLVLFYSSLALYFSIELQDDSTGLYVTGALISLVLLNYLLSRINYLRTGLLRNVFPVVSVLIFLVILKGHSISYLGFEFELFSFRMIFVMLMGSLVFEFAQLKLTLVTKFLGEFDQQWMLRVILLFFIGFGLFLGSFTASSYGMFLFGAGYIISGFYRTDQFKEIAISIIAIAVVKQLIESSSIVSIDLLLGKVIEGLFFGAFILIFIQVLWETKTKRLLKVAIGYILSSIVSIGLLLLYTQKSDLGGIDAFAGIIVGFALTNAIVGKESIALSVLVLLLVGGIYLAPKLVNEELQSIEMNLLNNKINNENKTDATFKTLNFSNKIGLWNFEQEKSLVSFELGPRGGVTKGVIRNVSGSIDVAESIGEIKLEVIMDLENFSTFNKMRDKELLGNSYFNSDKFPHIKYSSKTISKANNVNTYEIIGDFEMLGVINELMISAQFVLDEKGNTFLIGQGSLDRTKFGMKPDASEGNIVDFSYQVLLIKSK